MRFLQRMIIRHVRLNKMIFVGVFSRVCEARGVENQAVPFAQQAALPASERDQCGESER